MGGAMGAWVVGEVNSRLGMEAEEGEGHGAERRAGAVKGGRA